MPRPRADRKAAIWDMDGVIADTAELHFKAWRRLVTELGGSLTYEQFLPTFGRVNADVMRELVPIDLTPEQIGELSDRKERYFREQIGPGFRALPGVVRLVRELHQHGYRQAIASSAPIENVELIVEVLQLKELFSAIVSGQDIVHGKPHPEVFLLAAERLGVLPRRSVVFEDSVAGVEAARAAGMSVIAITNSWTRDALWAADVVVDSVEEVTLSQVDSLIGNRHSQG